MSISALAMVASAPAGAVEPVDIPGDAGEPGDAGDSRTTARWLPGPGEYTGRVSYPDDRNDWYAFSVQENQSIGLRHVAGDVPRYHLYRANGPEHEWDGGAVSVDAALFIADPTPGTWFLRVEWSYTGNVPYTFDLRLPSDQGLTADRGQPVVVATFDTGTNPFHPCLGRPGLEDPRTVVPGYPHDSISIPLSFRTSYASSLIASESALDTMEPHRLYHFPGTSLSYYSGAQGSTGFVDDWDGGHGAQASSQIGCKEYGMAPNAHLVILNIHDAEDDDERRAMLDWVAAQPWIDIVHLNIQDIPVPYPLGDTVTSHVSDVVNAGKLVVVAAGNGVAGQAVNYPMEVSRWNGAPGTLIVGASDNTGYTAFSNLDPHVVMDGAGTEAAQPFAFGATDFSGTSSASPRVAGYAAALLGHLRAQWGHSGYGLLTIPNETARPTEGPLVDGVLDAQELHEVIRLTARPGPHMSRYDGALTAWNVPAPWNPPVANYAKEGYGKLSEFTLPDALAVISGERPAPDRPVEDTHYAASEAIRTAFWR